MNRRRWALLGGTILLVAALVGGRWFALQTAERLWAATIPFGAAYLHGLALARTWQWIVAGAAVAWGVGHCYLVYRAIGSVQMPRRVGDIEIVEAVPHRLLVTVTLLGGLLYGGGLAWAIGDVWRQAVLAGAPPHFGAVDPVLGRDLGYYLGELPWDRTRQGILLLATLTAAALITALYAAIGSLRLHAGRLRASPHARAHLGITLAGLALAFLWGAHLDPAETVAGLAGTVSHATLAIRLPAADVVAVVALGTALLSAAWGWWDRPGVVGTAWLSLLVTMLAAYWILPPGLQRTQTNRLETADTLLTNERAALDRLAYDADAKDWRPGVQAPAAVLAGIPAWDALRVSERALHDSAVGPGLAVVRVALGRGGDWLLGLAPDGASLLHVTPLPTWQAVHEGAWAQAPGPLQARESDSELLFSRVPGAPPQTWFGMGFTEYAVLPPGSVPGIPLEGTWRRIALAWTLQSTELAREQTAGRTLVWRRDALERFSVLAPFAEFEAPTAAVLGDSLWWVSWGYVEGETFPLVDPVTWNGRTLRYRHPGLIAALNAVTGTTRIWLSPRADSLSAAWAHIAAPLVEPAATIPPALLAALPYPADGFRIAAVVLAREDSANRQLRPADPFTLVARDGEDTTSHLWTAQTFEDTARPPNLRGILAGTVTGGGPSLQLWSPAVPPRVPVVLASDPNREAGVLRAWPLDAQTVLTVQARFWQPEHSAVTARLDSVYVSIGPLVAGDTTPALALRALLRGPALADSSPAASLRRVRALVARMDSALATGRMSRFGVLYDSLRALLRGVPRGVAAPGAPR